MRVNNIQNQPKSTFGSVTPIIATEKGKRCLERVLSTSKGKYVLEDLTDIYSAQSRYAGILQRESHMGKRILFLFTGSDYLNFKYNKQYLESVTRSSSQITDRMIEKISETSAGIISKLLKRTEMQRDLDYIDKYLQRKSLT